jgi:4-aminobutyrate aminotransferase-like enzyme
MFFATVLQSSSGTTIPGETATIRYMIQDHIVYSEYSNFAFKLSKAEGIYLWDDTGRRLIDFSSGWNVTNLGWNHPEVVEAFVRQASKNTYAPMWSAEPIQEEYAGAILDAYPGMDTAIRVTGGTEANEVAVKLARAATGRTKIIGFKDTYHGQLFAAMALGYRPEYVTAIDPLVPDFIQLDYPARQDDNAKDAETLASFKAQLEDSLSKRDVAGIFIEAGIITGWGACRIAVDGFVEAVRELTSTYGTLLVVDEVGTGFSRTGSLFGIEQFKVKPDIATLAKGISNGTGGLGAVLSRAELVEPTIGGANYTSTFGWMPTSCAAALATLQIHQRDKVWENATSRGEQLISQLRSTLPQQTIVRGKGLEVCVDLTSFDNANELAKQVVAKSHEAGLHLAPSGGGIIQLMPPCVIGEKELSQGVAILGESVTASVQ